MPFIAGSLESANSSILAARNLFKDFGGGKNQDFMIISGQSVDFFTSDVILQRHELACRLRSRCHFY